MIGDIVVILAVVAAYGLFVLVKPDKRCGRCGGWGNRKRRRRNRACGKCKGTGTAFRPGAGLVHKGAALAVKRMRERAEGK